MPSTDDIYSGDTLKAADIQGREPTVTIKSVEPREFQSREPGGRPSKKLVISFAGARKTFVCNKTNGQRIAYLHGKDYSKWVGKQITLFVDPFVQFGNEITPAIRVKPPALNVPPAPSPAPQSSEELEPAVLTGGTVTSFDDEIPF